MRMRKSRCEGASYYSMQSDIMDLVFGLYMESSR